MSGTQALGQSDDAIEKVINDTQKVFSIKHTVTDQLESPRSGSGRRANTPLDNFARNRLRTHCRKLMFMFAYHFGLIVIFGRKRNSI